MIINVLVIVIALLPILVVMFGYEYYAVRKATLQEVRVEAAIVSDNAAAAMAFEDAATASEALATLQASPDTLRAALFLPSGKLLATYSRKDIVSNFDESIIEVESEEEFLSKDVFKLQKRIYLKTQFVGALVLESGLDSFYRRIYLYFSVISLVALAGMAFSIWLAMILKKTITNPLSELMAAVDRVTQKQDYSVRPKVETSDEIGDLSRAFRDMMSNMQERDNRLQDMAYFDSVTGLPNRHYFKDQINKVVFNALRKKSRCCLMFIDLDDFKIVNDSLGHHVGDSLLSEVGKRISRALRNNDIVFRIGGDEFALILEDVTDLDITRMLAERIIKALSVPANLHGHEVHVGASVGISACPDFASDASSLIKTADSAMYVVKGKKKNDYHLYGSDVNAT
jgi:diguanylate cyclase (GGDEF)-like protein